MKGTKSRITKLTIQLFKEIVKLSVEDQENLLILVKEWGSDERKAPRKQYLMTVDYSDEYRVGHGFIENISAGGLYIEPSAPFPVKKPIIMTFQHPSGDKHIKLNTKIAWKSPSGMGVQFDQKIEGLTEQ